MTTYSLTNPLTQLFNEYQPKVLSYFRCKTNYSEDTDDLVSEVFEKIVNNYHTFDSEKASLSTWVFTIARNVLIDYYKHKTVVGVTSDVDDYGVQQDLSVENDVLSFENLDLLGSALQRLKEKERDIIIMHFYYGYDLQEIATKMNLSYANVRVMQSRAFTSLRKYLGKGDF